MNAEHTTTDDGLKSQKQEIIERFLRGIEICFQYPPSMARVRCWDEVANELREMIVKSDQCS